MTLRTLNLLLSLLLLMFSTYAKSEIIDIKIYFDKNWKVCKPEQASYYRISGWNTENRVYEGDFKDYTINEIKINEGTFVNGKKKGVFNFYFDSGSLKTSAFYHENKPDSIWTEYNVNKQISFKIHFENEQFEIIDLYDSLGNSVYNLQKEFIHEFQNDTSHSIMKIIGMLNKGVKEGKWSIMLNRKTIGYDIYKNGKYEKTKILSGTNSTIHTPIIINSLFEPYSIYSCEKLFLNKNIEESDYPFLSHLMPKQLFDNAVGLIGDSAIFIIDKKPKYLDGEEGFYKTLALHTHLGRNIIQNVKKWGWVYYEITINEKGEVIEKKILKSPHVLFNDVVINALNHLQLFEPAYLDGKAIKSKITSRILFKSPTIINMHSQFL